MHQGNTSTFNTSLNDIIEVWQQLHFNDGEQDAPPLTVTLTSQPKFSTSVSKLQKAVNDGQGISSLPQPYSADDEDYQDDGEAEIADEYSVEEGQDFAAGEEHYEEHEDSHPHEHPEEQEAYQEEQGTELEGSHETIDQADEKHQAYEHPAEAAEGSQDEINYEDFNELEEYPDPEDFDQHEDADTNAETPEVPAQDEASEKKAAEDVKPDSAASSTTVRGDSANDTAGEYDPDLIVWDDDEDLTRGYSEAHADDGDDLFSTLVADYDGDAGEPDVKHAQKPDEEPETLPKAIALGNELSEIHSSGVDAEEQVAFGVDTEDLLSYDDNDQQAQGEVASAVSNNDQPQKNSDDDGLIEYDDETFDEADNVDHDNQDEEQFHTALDLLDGDDTEHGSGDSNTAETNKRQEKIVDEDDIGYDDDDDFGQPQATAKGSANSPLGKRSFEEHADEDELNFDDEPELKKARSD